MGRAGWREPVASGAVPDAGTAASNPAPHTVARTVAVSVR